MLASTLRRCLSLASLVALLGATVASAEPAPRNPSLAARGPISTVHPLPLWYQDAAGVQLEPCLDTTTVAPPNPCKLVAGPGVSGAFDPALPIVYPTNFPAITAYHWLNTEVSTNVGGKVNTRGLVYTAEVVGAANGGLPAVYTHLRFDTNEKLTAGASYKITHPYGVFTLTVDAQGGLCPANNKLCDIFFPVGPPITTDLNNVLTPNLSVNPNDVTVGTYLHDITPPAGFVGNGAGRVQILGSPKGTNFVRIEGPTSGPGSTDLGTSCTVTTAGTVANCAENISFTILGRIFVPAGGPTTRLAVTGPATGGAGVAQAFTVTATDVNGNTTTGYTGIVRLSSNDPLASLGGDATLVSGVGTFQATPRTVGTFTLTATDTVRPAVTGSTAVTVTAGPVATLVAVSGGGQVAGTGATLALPLVVRAADAFGNPKGGVSVTFTPPVGGAVSPASTLTDLVSGQASTTATLGPAAGAQTFSAAAVGVATPVTFAAAAGVPGEPTTLAITSLPASTTAGATAPFTVSALDAFGNPATLATGATAGALSITSTDPAATLPATPVLTSGTASFSATFRTAGSRTLTATLTATPAITASATTAVSPAVPATLAVAGLPATTTAGVAGTVTVVARDAFANACTNFAGPLTVTSTDPAATLPVGPALTAGAASLGVTLKTAGPRSVTVAITSLPAVTGAASSTVVAAAATTLAVASGNAQSGAVGSTLGLPLAVRVTDAFANPVAGTAVTFAATTAGASVATPSAVTGATGLASSSATLATTVLGAQAFSATSAGLAGSPATFSATALPGAPTTVALTGLAAGTTAGVATPATVTVRDQFGNVVTNYAGSLSFASSDATAVLPAPGSLLPGGTGVVSFTFKKAGAQSVTVTATGVATPTGSASTAVSAGAAASIAAVSGGGQTGVAGTNLAAALVVRVADASGNPVAGASVTFAAPAGGSVTPALATTLADGTAAATGTLPSTTGATTFTASAAGLTGSPVTFAASAVAGAPTVLHLAGLPAASIAGDAVTVTVDAFDALGNPAANFSGALLFGSSDAAALLPAGPALAFGTGTFQVTFHGAGARTLTVTLSGTPTATATGNITVAPAAPAALALSGLPASTVAGTVIPVTVSTTDAFGNACTNFAGPVTFTSSDPAAALPAGASLTGGAGSFSVTLRTAGSRTVTAALASPAISGSQSSTVTNAAAATLAVASGNNQAGVVGQLLALPLAARVTDAFGNPVAGSTVAFAAVTAGASVTTTSALTAADGTASTTARLATTPIGAQSFGAASAGLTPASVTFTATAQPGTPTSVTIAGLPASVTAGVAVPITVSVLDQSLNVATGYLGTVSFTSTDTSAVLPAPVALVNGTGLFNVTFKKSGAQGVTVTATNATPFVHTASTTVQAAAPFSIAAVSGGGQSGEVHAALAQPFVVKVVDAFGNAAPGAPVAFTAPATGSVTPASTTTAADGTASATGTLPSAPGATAFGASATGVATGVSFAATAVPGAPASLQLTGVAASTAAGAVVVVTVSAFDGQSPPNPATNFTGSVSLSSTDPLAVLPPSVLLAGGTGTFQITFGKAGARSVTATLAGPPLATGSAATTVTAGPASGLAIASGDPQAGTVGLALPAPLVVRVTDLFGNPVQGTTITFTAPATGAVTPTTAATAADGTASTGATLGRTAGAQTFTATAAGLSPSSLSFHAVAAPGPATALVLSGLPAGLAAGTPASVTVSVFDAFGNAATGFAGVVALTSNDPAAVLPAQAALPAGTGVGTFQIALRTIGTHTVTAAAVGAPTLTDTKSTVVGPAAPATLAVVASPGSTRVGLATASPFTVKVSDGLGNPVGNVTVTFAAVAGGSITPTTTTTAADGTASATPTMGTAAQVYDFTATSGTLAGSPATLHVTATPDAGTHLALERAAGPTAIDCGCYDLTARLQDQFGNTVAQGVPGVTVAVTAPALAQITSTDLVATGLPAATVTGTLKSDGTALVRVCDQKPEAVSVTTAAAGFSGASLPLTWLLGPLDPTASGIVSDTALLTAYSGRAHLTVTPRSACGNPLGAGQSVLLGLSGPGSITATTDRGDGRYTATADVTPCPVTLSTQVTARVGAVDLAPLGLAIACVAPSAGQTQVLLARSALQLCDDPALDQVAVTVTPRDAAGAPLGAGNQVSLAMAGLTGGAVTDAGDGSYTATLSAADCSVTAARPLTVRVNGVDLAPPGSELTVTCAPVDGGASGVSVAGGPGVANGTSQLEVTVAAVNTCNRPARGRAVQLSTTLGTLGAPTGTTDAAGTHHSWLTSATAGAATLSATVGGVAVTSASATFDAPPSKGGGGCSSGGAAGLPALVLLGLGLLRRGARRPRG